MAVPRLKLPAWPGLQKGSNSQETVLPWPHRFRSPQAVTPEFYSNDMQAVKRNVEEPPETGKQAATADAPRKRRVKHWHKDPRHGTRMGEGVGKGALPRNARAKGLPVNNPVNDDLASQCHPFPAALMFIQHLPLSLGCHSVQDYPHPTPVPSRQAPLQQPASHTSLPSTHIPLPKTLLQSFHNGSSPQNHLLSRPLSAG